jgi:hypothetical protein
MWSVHQELNITIFVKEQEIGNYIACIGFLSPEKLYTKLKHSAVHTTDINLDYDFHKQYKRPRKMVTAPLLTAQH